MSRTAHILLLLLLLTTTPLRAQELSGQVTDASTGEPIGRGSKTKNVLHIRLKPDAHQYNKCEKLTLALNDLTPVNLFDDLPTAHRWGMCYTMRMTF